MGMDRVKSGITAITYHNICASHQGYQEWSRFVNIITLFGNIVTIEILNNGDLYS